MLLLVVFLVCAGFGYWQTARRGLPLPDRIHRALVYGIAGGLILVVVFSIAGGLTP